jgi:hypothetical protein
MELFEMELEDARKRVQASGRNPDDFEFKVEFLPPDPDGGGMFTVRYEVTAVSKNTGKNLEAIGGIGLDWVGYFDEALREGHFD